MVKLTLFNLILYLVKVNVGADSHLLILYTFAKQVNILCGNQQQKSGTSVPLFLIK
jgi:hypothetical protein